MKGKPPTRRDYVTSQAIEDAVEHGLHLSFNDWRSVFLAITDQIAGDGPYAPPHVTAALKGNTRDAERWSICWRGMMVDAIYDPSEALILRIITWRPSNPAMSLPVPKPKPDPVADGYRRVSRYAFHA